MPYIGGRDDQVLAFYAHMWVVSQIWGILPCKRSQRTPGNQPSLSVLRHYGCPLFLADMGGLGKLATADCRPDAEATESLNAWLDTSQARLATLHCAYILIHSAEITDLTVLVPR